MWSSEHRIRGKGKRSSLGDGVYRFGMDGFGYGLDVSALEVEQTKGYSPSRSIRELTRYRYQALGGLIAAVLLPAMLRGVLLGDPGYGTSYDNSLIGSTCAVALGFLI